MVYADFIIHYNPEVDTPEIVAKKIFYTLWIKPLKANKPVVNFISGGSGEGKSLTVLRIIEVLCEIQNIDVMQYMHDMNIYSPVEYSTKMDRILFDKKLKRLNMLAIHEARELVKAKNWQSFLTQAISDVNAMSRSIKRICFFVVSQFIRDVTSDVRYTLNYYCTVKRPIRGSVKLYIQRIWHDDSDLDKPKLRKRRLNGYLVYPDGKWRRYQPSYVEISLPNEKLVEEFDKADTLAKSSIIRRKLNRLIEEMKKDIGDVDDKVNHLLKWYVEHPENIQIIGRRYRGKWCLKPEVAQVHQLDKHEAKMFEEKITDYVMKQQGDINARLGQVAEPIRSDGQSGQEHS